MAKTTVHKVLFLVSMDSQRSKELDGSQFWALECLLTASGWLESIRAIMAPPRVITSFQSSCEIGLMIIFELYTVFQKSNLLPQKILKVELYCNKLHNEYICTWFCY